MKATDPIEQEQISEFKEFGLNMIREEILNSESQNYNKIETWHKKADELANLENGQKQIAGIPVGNIYKQYEAGVRECLKGNFGKTLGISPKDIEEAGEPMTDAEREKVRAWREKLVMTSLRKQGRQISRDIRQGTFRIPSRTFEEPPVLNAPPKISRNKQPRLGQRNSIDFE